MNKQEAINAAFDGKRISHFRYHDVGEYIYSINFLFLDQNDNLVDINDFKLYEGWHTCGDNKILESRKKKAQKDKHDSETDKYYEAKQDKGKLPYELIPPFALEELAKVYQFGAEKYGRNTWQDVPNAIERYEGALMRHFFAWRKGEVDDPESGLPHLSHVLCVATMLICLDEGKEHKKYAADSDKMEFDLMRLVNIFHAGMDKERADAEEKKKAELINIVGGKNAVTG